MVLRSPRPHPSEKRSVSQPHRHYVYDDRFHSVHGILAFGCMENGTFGFFFSFIDTTCFCLCPATTNLFTGEAIRPNRRSRSALIITRLQHDRTRRQDRLEIGTRTNIVRDLLEAISRTTFLQIY